MPLITTRTSGGAFGLGWSAATDEGSIIWDFSSYSGTATSNDGVATASPTGAVLQLHSGYGVDPTNTAWYWSNIKNNTTASVITKGVNAHASGSGYFGNLFWQIGGCYDIYHSFAENFVRSYNGASWSARSSMPNDTSRTTAACDNSVGLFVLPGSKYPTYEGFPADYINKFYKLTSVTGSWTALTNTPDTYRQSTYPAYTSGGYVTIVNDWGLSSYLAYRYNVASNTWSALSVAPVTGIGYVGIANGNKYWFADHANNRAYSIKETETTWSVGQVMTGTHGSPLVAIDNTVYSVQTGTKTP